MTYPAVESSGQPDQPDAAPVDCSKTKKAEQLAADLAAEWNEPNENAEPGNWTR